MSLSEVQADNSAATLPFAEAFTAPKLFWQPGAGPSQTIAFNDYGGRCNEMTALEIRLQQALVKLGRGDMAAAVAGGRKYQRLAKLLWGHDVLYEGLVGLRLAFNPEASFPESQEAWIEEAKTRFASDEGLAEVIAAWEEECAAEKALSSISSEMLLHTQDASGTVRTSGAE